MKCLLVAMAFVNVLSIGAMFYPRPIHRGQGAMMTIFALSLLATELAWTCLVLQLALVVLCSYLGAPFPGVGEGAGLAFRRQVFPQVMIGVAIKGGDTNQTFVVA